MALSAANPLVIPQEEMEARASSRPILPKLIFAESNHWDPVTRRILTKLLPKLKSIGYKSFYDETASPITFDYLLDMSQQTQEACAHLKEVSQNKGFDLSDCHGICLNESQIEKLKQFAKAAYPGITDKNIMKYVSGLSEVLAAHEIAPANVAFLQALQNQHINYQGIDLPGTGKHLLYSTLKILHIFRDQHMMQAYLEAKQGVFGTVGLGHLDGMQKIALTQLTPDAASANFCFFNIYERPYITEDESKNDDRLDEKIHSGDVTLPLGLTVLNANQHSDDQIIEIIINQIQEKQQSLMTREHLLKYKEISISPSGQIKIDPSEIKKQQSFIERYIKRRADNKNKPLDLKPPKDSGARHHLDEAKKGQRPS